MEVNFSARASDAVNPFYPFDQLVREIFARYGGYADTLRSIHRSPQAEKQALSLYLRPQFNGFAMSLILLDSGSKVVQRTMHDLVRSVLDAAGVNRDTSSGQTPNSHTIHIKVDNAWNLPPSFLKLAGYAVQECHRQNVSLSIGLDCWAGDDLPLGVWARRMQGCPDPHPLPDYAVDPEPGLEPPEAAVDPAAAQLAVINLDQLIRIFLADSVELYQQQLLYTIFSADAELEVRQWSWLLLSRSQGVDKILPKVLAELVKPGGVDPRLFFVLHVGIGAYYYEHNYLDEASRFFEQAYAQYRDTPYPVQVHHEIQRFFWMKMGDLLSKNREYLQEPARVFYRRALSIPQKDGELLSIQARRGLAYHLGVESVFDQAHREIAMALDLARQMGYVREMFNCRRILGAIYQMQGKTSLAVEQLQQALDHSESSGNPLEVAKIHNTIAYIQMTDGQFSSSLNHNILALQMLITRFHPRYVEEMTNTISTMIELAMFSGNPMAALDLLRYNMEISSFFSSRRSERHWNMIQSFRYMTYVYWRLDQPGQARVFLARYELNVRQFEHYINTFEQQRYRLLLSDNPTREEIDRILAPVLPHLETTIHVRMMLVQFFLDLHRKTGHEDYYQRAVDTAKRFSLSHLVEYYHHPAEIDWAGIERRVPMQLLQNFVGSDKRLKSLQATLYRYDTVHEFSQRIINQNNIDEVIDYLFPIVRSQLEADALYLYLSVPEGFLRIRSENDTVRQVVTAREDAVLAWAEQELKGGVLIPGSMRPGNWPSDRC